MNLEFLIKIKKKLFLLGIFFLPVYQTINHWFFGAFLAISILLFITKKEIPISSSSEIKGLLFAISSFFLIQVFGLFYAIDFDHGLKGLIRALPFLLYPIAIVGFKGFVQFSKFEKDIFYTLSAGCTLAAIICWGYILTTIGQASIPANTFLGWKKSGIYLTEILDLHPPYLGLLIVASILFLLKESIYNKSIRPPKKRLNTIWILVLFFFLFNITARNALFFLVSFLILYSIYKKAWKLFAIQLIIGTLLATIVINHPSQYYRLKFFNMLGLSENSIKDRRFDRLTASYNVFKSSPLIGVGPGNDINLKIEQYKLMNDQVAVQKRLNSHNQFFEYLAKFGIIGGALFLIVNLFLIFFFWRNHQYFYLVLIISFLISTITESTFERALGIQYYCIVVSLGILSSLSSSDYKRSKV